MINTISDEQKFDHRHSITKRKKIMSIVLDDTKIKSYKLEDRIRESDMVVDIARPFYRNKLEFRSEKVKEICLKNINSVYIDGNRYATKYFSEAKSQFMKWVVNKPNEKIYKNKSLKELFVYDNNISLWWLTKISHKNFNKTEVPTYFHQKACLEYILKDFRNFFLDNSNEYKIFLFSSNKIEFSYFSSIIKKILCSRNNEEKLIKYQIINPLEQKNEKFFYSDIFSIIITTGKVMLNLYRLNLIGSFKSKENNFKNYDHIVATNFPGDWYSKSEESPLKKRDRYLDELYAVLSKEGLRIAYLPILKSPEEFKEWEKLENKPAYIQENFSNISILYFFFKYITYQIYWYSLFCLLYNKSVKNHDLNAQETSSNKILDLIILIDLGNVIKKTVINYLYHYEFYKNVISNRTKSILFVQEYYAKSRVIKAAIKNCKTKIFGVQHGSASRMYYQYEFHSSETGMTKLDRSLNRDYINHVPIPDYNFLFGPYHKNILLNHNGYPESRLIVTGPLRNDYMAKKSININKNEIDNIKASLRIPIDRNILLFCSSHRLRLNLLSFITEAINISKSKPYFLIKLHPVIEKQSRYIKHMKQLNLINYKFVNSKIDDLIFASNLIVTELSNVAYESVICNKPHLVISKYIDLRDSPGFFEKPVIMSSKNVNETGTLIDTMIQDYTFKEQFNRARVPFLKKYFFNLDGEAIKRAGLILESH